MQATTETTMNYSKPITAMRYVRSSNTIRHLAAALVVVMVVITLLLTVVPWVQTVTGKGKVTALSPDQRPQTIEALITGRISDWRVGEGAEVKQGDTIVVLQDIDPKFLDSELLLNQERQLDALKDRRLSIIRQIEALGKQVVTEGKARESGVKAAQEKLSQITQKRIAAEEQVKQARLDVDIAKQRFADRKSLYEKGLLSERNFENAKLELQRSEVGQTRTLTELEAGRRAEAEALATITNKESEGTSKILKVISDESKALETLAALDNSIAKAESDLNAAFSRRAASIIRAPVAGTVVRLLTAGYGETVKQGDKLAVIAPKTTSLAVELTVSGTNAPLIADGKKVRLQFDGFPAFQLSGWPAVSVGTFGGIVSVIDAVDDEQSKGAFRVVVRPDPDDEPWPESKILRPGTQSLGWMQLNTVSLGYEMWRQLNGFPPSVDKPKPPVPSPEKYDADEEK